MDLSTDFLKSGQGQGRVSPQRSRVTLRKTVKTENDHNKAGYTATPVACGWAGAIIEVTPSFGQEQVGQKPQKNKKSKV